MPDYSVYSGVEDFGVVKLSDGVYWLGIVTAKVSKPGQGISDTEDLRRKFSSEAEAWDWVNQRVELIQKLASERQCR